MESERKQLQKVKNYLAENLYEMAINEAFSDEYFQYEWKQLKYNKAWVIETENFYILRSYDTIVAVIEKATDIMADVLRLVYGYTSTSCQHIRKFCRAYGKDKWGCKIEYTYRQIS